MSPVLVLDHDDEERELEFELAFLRSLTTQQRFDLMFQRRVRWRRFCFDMDTESLLKLLNAYSVGM